MAVMLYFLLYFALSKQKNNKTKYYGNFKENF